MDLYLTRHGQTDYNVEDRYQGSQDLPLNATGQAQALELAEQAPSMIDVIASSPQLRARQTAEPMARQRGLPLVVVEAFRERRFGIWEGLTGREARALDPEFYDRGGIMSFTEQPQGAESLPELVRRSSAGVCELLDRFPQGQVLLVTHGFTIRALRLQFSGMPPEDLRRIPRAENGEVFHVAAPTLEQWRLRRVE